MRYLLFLFCLTLFAGCSVFKSDNKEAAADAAVPADPTDLQGPAYDPATSPVPMSSSTRLPVPAGSQPVPTADQPAAYGSVPLDPAQEAKGATGPETYQSSAAAPTAYGPAPGSAEAGLAAVLSGLWVNNADPKETVEFTPDHYTTFYNGEMLFQEAMTYHANCPGDCNGGVAMDIACFTISGPAGTDCYGIIRLTPEVLEMSMLGISTESILYTKQ